MELAARIDSRRREIRTDGYPVSIGEWIALYERGELDIHPEFQRFFRWTDAQKTLLIESVLLGIPIPSIFVSQRSDGVWDVVDGLQRLSTILQFVGVLKGEDGKPLPPLTLSATKYIPELQGVMWDGKGEKALPEEIRLIFKRSKINSSIVLRESDENTKYDLFERLNTGGSQASDQEVRNCILVMLNPEMFRWLRSLADIDEFKDCISISDRLTNESYDLELVLRFLIFYDIEEPDLANVGDVSPFLTERLRAIASDAGYDLKRHEDVFRRTFSALKAELDDDAFKKFCIEKNKFLGGFAISQFETVACGVAFNIARQIAPTSIGSKVAGLWGMQEYTAWTGSGITAARRLPRLIPLGRELFSS